MAQLECFNNRWNMVFWTQRNRFILRWSRHLDVPTVYIALKKWILRQAIMGVSVTLLLVVGIYFSFPLIIQRFLLAYVPGIPAMKIIFLGLSFLPIARAFGNFLNTVDKQAYCMAVLHGCSGLCSFGQSGTQHHFCQDGVGDKWVHLGNGDILRALWFDLSLCE